MITYKVNLVAVMVDLLLPGLGVRQGMVPRDLSATLNMTFSVTYCLELCNVISISKFINKCYNLVVWTFRTLATLLGKNLF